jgi:hypothetical protein
LISAAAIRNALAKQDFNGAQLSHSKASFTEGALMQPIDWIREPYSVVFLRELCGAGPSQSKNVLARESLVGWRHFQPGLPASIIVGKRELPVCFPGGWL